MAEEKKFAKGLFFKKRTLDFGDIIAMSVKADDFIEFIKQNTNEKGYCNIDIFPQKPGSTSTNSHYAALNTWVPDASKAKNNTQSVTPPPVQNSGTVFGNNGGTSEDLPF